ncbi:MAG: MBL fold metallo-hydrolase [Roseivirga sp.]
MITIKSFTFNPFMENTYVLSDSTGEAVIIDPGCYEKHEEEELKAYIDREGLNVKLLLNTHGHIDHVLGNAFVKNTFGVPLWIGTHDVATLKSVEAYAPSYGFQQYQSTEPDHLINEGDSITFGKSELQVVFVPGHAAGHIAFYHMDQRFCIGGDVLFRESIGRTDLPGGDYDTLIKSIHTKFFAWPDDMVIHTGHGPHTTIGHEKAHNPFCAIDK